jgi:hypothetical protein
MPVVEFEPTIPVIERTKTVNALDRAATVEGNIERYKVKNIECLSVYTTKTYSFSRYKSNYTFLL